MTKPKFSIIVLVVFIIGFFAGAAVVWVFGSTLFPKRGVRLIQDIDLNKDHYFAESKIKTSVSGLLRKGSIGWTSFKKARAVYVNFPVVLDEDKLEFLGKN